MSGPASPLGSAAVSELCSTGAVMGAVMTVPHDGHEPSPLSSGGFQNLLQSSHQGNGAVLSHGTRLCTGASLDRPVRRQ